MAVVFAFATVSTLAEPAEGDKNVARDRQISVSADGKATMLYEIEVQPNASTD
ncbi:MAG: hypothetical protein GXY83_34365 [Rhodopirellula sp.]|nr:hypothetical protein [Rhodopirellula sp.]